MTLAWAQYYLHLACFVAQWWIIAIVAATVARNAVDAALQSSAPIQLMGGNNAD